jgi:hypothetical protein
MLVQELQAEEGKVDRPTEIGLYMRVLRLLGKARRG